MRLIIDNDQNLDNNNVYLPETISDGSIANNGSITIDSVLINDSSTPASTGSVDASVANQVTFPYTGYFSVFLLGTDGVPTLNLTTPNTTYSDIESVLMAVENLLSAHQYYTFFTSGTNYTLTTNAPSTNTNTFSITADSQDILTSAPLSGGSIASNIQFKIGANILVTLTAPNQVNNSDASDTIATKLRTALNALPAFSPDGVSNVNNVISLQTTVMTDVYNDLPIIITDVGGGSIVTSNMFPLTGGISAVSNITPTLAPINKSRKSFFHDTKAYIKGFCGFIGLHTMPQSKLLQSDFFSIDDNKCVIDNNNGIGFEHKISNIQDGTHYFAVALRLNSLNNVSNVLTEHLAFKISRVSNNLTVSLVEITDKTVANGWVISNEILIIEESDLFEYSQNDSISFIYPNQNPTAIQFLMKNSNGLVKKAITLTSGSKFDAIVSKVSNNVFALFHILANPGANAELTVIKSLSK